MGIEKKIDMKTMCNKRMIMYLLNGLPIRVATDILQLRRFESQ